MRRRYSPVLFSWLGPLALLALSGRGVLFSWIPPAPARGAQASERSAAPAERVPGDWQNDPAIVERTDLPEDLYALGDVHGDYHRLVRLLHAAKILESEPMHAHEARWAAGRALLVCTGDLIDKGKHSLKVLSLVRALQKSAAAQGGQVIVTMGNHEAEFLADPGNDKSRRFVAELRTKGIHPEQVAAARDQEGIGTFLHGLPLAARIGDWFFAHAGNTRGMSLKQLRAELQTGIDARGYDLDTVLPLEALLDARLHPLPWWEAKGETAPASVARLTGYLRALGVRHLVIGHQPGRVRFADGSKRLKGELSQKFDGLLFLIDVGMSRGLDDGPYSDGALLRIQRGVTATIIQADESAELIWRASR